MRRLIINADDFGYTTGVNRGIEECWRDGVVTSTTLMANASGFDDAVARIGELSNSHSNRPSVGCHVVLLEGEPLLGVERVPTLVVGNKPRLRQSIMKFAAAAWRGRLSDTEIAAETAAQIERLQAAGVRLSHVDSHKHAHMFPAVLTPVLQAARECGVRAIRNPFAPALPLPTSVLLRRTGLWKRFGQVKILRHWAADFRRAVQAQDIATTDGTFGIVITGAFNRQTFDAVVSCIPDGTWELCCHPGYNDAELARADTRLRESRDEERRVLTSEAARETLKRHGIELISYWDLQ